jgi:hypothetical protein
MSRKKIHTPTDVESLEFDELIPYTQKLMEGFKPFQLPGDGSQY